MRALLALMLGLLVTACASGPPFIDQMQPIAVDKAVKRAQFELNCPSATGQILNRQALEPVVFGGPIRAQYTVGVSGCDKRVTVDVVCSENGNQCVEGPLGR